MIAIPGTDELTAVNQRLAALIEINLQLSSETDPRHLLETVCHAARELTGAKYAIMGVNSTGRAEPDHFVTSGMDAETAGELATTLPLSDEIGMILARRQSCRIDKFNGGARSLGFPPHHPPARCFLGAPMVSASQIYGWLCLTDKLGAEMFTEEDERIATILAAQVGRAYENRGLYVNLQRKAVELGQEVAEHKKAEQEVRDLYAGLEQRVEARTAELKAANVELEAFAFSISHDLRGPLRHVNGYVDMLTQSAGDSLAKEPRRFLATIADSTRQMGVLIDGLLGFSRMGRVEMRSERVELGKLVEDALTHLAPETQGRNMVWKKGPLPAVQGDAVMLAEVFINLLSNAVKYTRPRDPARIEIGCAGDTAFETVVFVRDNGVGFDMAYADNLFGVFQRLHLDDEFEGTGIGLANVRRVILRHGGRTWAEAKPDEGATFYFSLPNTQSVPVP